MITVEEALRRVLASAETPLEEEKVALADGLWPGARSRPLRRCAPSRRSQFRHGRLRAARRRYGLAARDAEGDRRVRRRPGLRRRASVRARRCASSPARRCRTAPTRSSFRRTSSREGERIRLSARRARQATICVRPAWTFATARRCSRPAAVSPPATSRWPRRPITPRSACADAPGSRSWRPATNWSRPAARWARRRSSPPTISPSPGWSKRTAASRSTSASRSMSSARSKAAIVAARDAKADVLVTLGGASVGDYDLVQQALVVVGHGARLLADRHAAGQAADARQPRAHARPRPAWQSDLVDGLRDPVPAPAAARLARRAGAGRRSQPARPPRRRPAARTASARTICAPRSAAARRRPKAISVSADSSVEVAGADGLIVRPLRPRRVRRARRRPQARRGNRHAEPDKLAKIAV